MSDRGKNGRYRKGHVLSKMENNSQWKGDEVGYSAIHSFIKRHLPKPNRCKKCNKIKSLDLTNISGKYLRDLIDWEWLCRSCHMISDGRINNLAQNLPKEIRSEIARKREANKK